MKHASSKRIARSSCGQLNAVTVGEPLRTSVCYCLACQLRTGSAFAVNARFRASEVQVTGISTVYARRGDCGKDVLFHFCATCGATVYYRLPGHPEVVGLTWGAFAGQPLPAPTVAHYETKKCG